MKHPLVNRASDYYYNKGKDATILTFERTYSLTDLRAWAKITKAKYEHPNRADKGRVESDKVKAADYGRYYNFLHELIVKYPPLADITAVNAYDALGIDMEY